MHFHIEYDYVKLKSKKVLVAGHMHTLFIATGPTS